VEEIGDWLGYLMEGDDDKLIQKIRQNTKTGRPCGGEDFIKKIEGLIGRRLRTLPRGRPRKR
jgi:putative transposase